VDVYEYVVLFHMNGKTFFSPTSKASHAGDSTPQNPEHDTGVGSGDWLGRVFRQYDTDRYVVFTNGTGKTPANMTTEECLSSLRRVLEWERTHPLEQRIPRSQCPPEVWDVQALATQRAIASLGGTVGEPRIGD